MTTFLITDVRIFDGENEIPSGSVLVEDGIIREINKGQAQQQSHSTVKTISKPGHTLLPGLIDGHIHAHSDYAIALPQALRFGVTTVCDMQSDPEDMVASRKQAAEDHNSADFKCCGLAATIDGGWPEAVVKLHDKSTETAQKIAEWPKLETESDAKQYIQDRMADKVDYIKLMHESGTPMGIEVKKPSVALQKAVIDAAHAEDFVVVAHSLAYDDTMEMLEAGVDGMTHTFYDKPPTEALIRAYKKNGAHCNPTLATIGSLTAEGKDMQHRYAHDSRVQHLIAKSQVEHMCACLSMGSTHGKLSHATDSVRMLKENGVEILCGSDAASPALGTAWGLSLHQEMAILVQSCGFTPAEALRSATVVPAQRLRFADRGRIAIGMKADLVLVEGNVLDDIDNSLNLRAVWRNGKLCQAFESSSN